MTPLEFVKMLNHYVWDYFLLYVLIGAGIFFTIFLGFPQIRHFFRMFKITFGGLFKPKKEGEISSFNALAVAVAAQVGTGNVAGVATAIGSGGPGAVFWMWVSGILGMSTIFVEAVLAQKYRQKDEQGNYYGGPAYYLTHGLKNKSLGRFLATFFSIMIVIALGFIGNMVQSNSISGAISEAVGGRIPLWILGVIIAIFAALVFIGGINRIANFATLVVPFMALIYVVLGIIILVKFRANIPSTFHDIFAYAFKPEAAAGGLLGHTVKQAMQKGIARGLFSNEAGMGSTPHAHATAIVDHPAEQGFTAMMGVFIDTIVICTFTALIILLTKANLIEGLKGVNVTQAGFESAFGHVGIILLAICLTFFAFTTIIGWYYFGESNFKYLFGAKSIRIYQVIVLIFIIVGATREVELVWNLADLFNGIMVIPNLIGIISMFMLARNIEKDYFNCLENGHVYYDYKN